MILESLGNVLFVFFNQDSDHELKSIPKDKRVELFCIVGITNLRVLKLTKMAAWFAHHLDRAKCSFLLPR